MDMRGRAAIWAVCAGLGIGSSAPVRAADRITKLCGQLVKLVKHDREQPVVKGSVSDSGRNSSPINEGGLFELSLLGSEYLPGQPVKVMVQVHGWEIYQPETGVVTLPEPA